MSLLAKGTIENMTCPVCGAKVTQMRRGRCLSCYGSWIETQPIAVGASCRVCGERRRENIQRVELLGRWYYMCHICAYRSVRLEPMPKHIEGIKARLVRNRRYSDRRSGQKDTREVCRERRVGERRVILLDEGDLLYDDDLFLDYDAPVDEGESTAVFQKIDLAELKEEPVPNEVELEL